MQDKNKGFLLAIEGIDGTGKTTIALKIKEKLIKLGYEVEIFKEPTNETKAGKQLRESYQNGRVSVDQELKWFIEDREWNVSERVLPALKNGKIVILDRYYYSTACYQGVRKNDDWMSILSNNREKFPEPDLTIIIDLDPAIAIKRIIKDRAEINTFEGEEYLQRVRNLFLEIFYKDEIGNFLLIDGSQTIGNITKIIFDIITQIIQNTTNAV